MNELDKVRDYDYTSNCFTQAQAIIPLLFFCDRVYIGIGLMDKI